jgi:putative MFS transporter
MEFPIGLSMVSELVPAKSRGRYVAVLEGFWPLGFIAAGVLAYLALPLVGWRGIFIALSIPAIFVFIVRRYVPESPRWLEDAGRVEEADAVTRNIERNVVAANGGKALPAPAAVVDRPLHIDKRALFAELWHGVYAKRTIMLWALWFFALLGYYGLTSWLGALLQQAGYAVTKSVMYTVYISLAGIPGFMFSAWLLEKWGRKPTCVLMLAGSAAAAYVYGQVATAQAPVVQLIGAGLCMQFFLFGMWSVLYAYTPELYPTRSRGTGSGFASSVGRLGSLLGPFAVGVILPFTGHTGVFTLGAISFGIAAVVVIVMGVETKGLSLEEVSG